LSGKKALYALTEVGLEVFDGEKWATVADAPSRGRTIAIRTIDGVDHVFIAGAHGVKAGTIDESLTWIPAAAPDAQYAAVYGGSRASGQMLFLTSRQQHEILVGEPAEAQWSELALPLRNTEITSVVPDPFTRDRYYVGTLGDGVWVYEGKTRRYVESRASLTGGTQ
jgi:hypothetical protein